MPSKLGSPASLPMTRDDTSALENAAPRPALPSNARMVPVGGWFDANCRAELFGRVQPVRCEPWANQLRRMPLPRSASRQ